MCLTARALEGRADSSVMKERVNTKIDLAQDGFVLKDNFSAYLETVS